MDFGVIALVGVGVIAVYLLINRKKQDFTGTLDIADQDPNLTKYNRQKMVEETAASLMRLNRGELDRKALHYGMSQNALLAKSDKDLAMFIADKETPAA